ncbi:MAG: NUDIX pyrophosphatase [Firmicutes bacterium]|nr:NUDIX pyrophosphatase [Bacillota bacterium]
MIRCIMAIVYRWRNNEPEYLLLKRSPALGGYWQPITGFIEEPEANRYAALRELYEETGISDYEKVIDPAHYYFFDMNGKKCAISVLAIEVKNDPKIRLSFEHTKYQWVNFQKASNMLHWENNVKALTILHQQLNSHQGIKHKS